MAKKILSIVETAYRATLEEQDDPVLWLTQVLRNQGGSVDVLLRGHAVAYAQRDQDATGLSFGGRAQTQPPQLARDVHALVKGGARVLFVREDAEERGITAGALVEGVEPVGRAALPGLLERYEQVWAW